MMRESRRMALAALAGCAVLAASPLRAADPWPSRPLKILVPYSAGSVTDVIVRRIAERLSARIGQPVVIDNRPGASGTIGLAAGLKAQPDGHTLIVGSTSNVSVSPALGIRGAFDPAKDFVPVAMYMKTPIVLLVHPSLGVRTLRDLVRVARARAEPLQYATGGQTSTTHFLSEMLQRSTGAQLTHVPYKGSTPALFAVLSGEVPIGFDFPATCSAHVAAGKLHALLVSGRTPVPLLPGVPTAIEAGYPDLDLVAWAGFLAPPGTPRAVVERVHSELAQVIGSPDMEERLRAEGSALERLSPEAFRAYIQADQAKWVRIVKETGITAEQ